MDEQRVIFNVKIPCVGFEPEQAIRALELLNSDGVDWGAGAEGSKRGDAATVFADAPDERDDVVRSLAMAIYRRLQKLDSVSAYRHEIESPLEDYGWWTWSDGKHIGFSPGGDRGNTDFAESVIRGFQDRFDLPAVGFEFAAVSGGMEAEEVGGGAVICPPGEETEHFDSSRWLHKRIEELNAPEEKPRRRRGPRP